MQIASAIGLRQVLPVQTNNMIRLAVSARVAASITPSRSMLQQFSSILTTVAKRWYCVGPASTTISMPLSPRKASAVVGTGWSRLAAIVMATGQGSNRKRSRTIGCDGLRSARSPAGEISDLTSSGRRLPRPLAMDCENTRIAGPGQSRQAIRRPICEISGTQSVTSSGPFKSSVSGREDPGPLSARTRATLSAWSAQAARTYTVSVASPTTPPCARQATAR